ncbi:MAG TPA: TonB-dependent receptor, partial [Fibrobacteraceae bacterium]|nr:TonB-dependent receptor [Fibrobacteraceae bacterium]
VYKQDGREIHQGVEAFATGNLLPSLTLSGGFTLMSAEVEKEEDDPDLEGKTPVDVPERMARIFLEYRFPGVLKGLAISAGGNYNGKRPVDAYNTDWIHSVTTFDAGLRYRMPFPQEHMTTLMFNVSNLLDKTYWESYESGLRLGSPRLFSLAMKMEL